MTQAKAKDLRKVFHDPNKYAVEFVDNADGADITLEVMGRSRRQNGSKAFIVPNGFGGFFGASRSSAQAVLFVRMKIGANYSKDFVGEGSTRLLDRSRSRCRRSDWSLDRREPRPDHRQAFEITGRIAQPRACAPP